MPRPSDQPRQIAAIIREWRDAVDDGDLALANRIAAANPDVIGVEVHAVGGKHGA